MSIRELIESGKSPSQAFRHLFEIGAVHSNSDLVDLLYTEFYDLSASVMPAVISWNRGTRPERVGLGLTDARLDEIIGVFIRSAMYPGANGPN
jgi:hypothetical protein